MNRAQVWSAMSGDGAPVPWWHVLSVQRWFVIVFVLSSLATSLALTYVFSEKYESSAAFSYRVQEVTRFKYQHTEALGSPAPQAPFKVIGSTLQEVLKNDSVLRPVVMDLRLYAAEDRTPSGPWYTRWYQATKNWLREAAGDAWQYLKFGRLIEEDPIERAIADLRKSIKVSNRDSYIFVLSVRDKSAERSARIVERLSAVLSDWLLDFDRQPGRTRAEQLRVLLDAKTQELSVRRREIETLLAGNKLTSVQQEGDRLTEQRFALRLELSRLDSEIARARQRLTSLDNKLRIKQRALEAMGSDPGTVAPVSEPSERISPEDFKRLASERVFNDLELNSLSAKRAALQTTVDEIAARTLVTPSVQNRYDTLRLAVASIEREYDHVNDAYQEAVLRSTSTGGTVSVLHPAVVPTAPVSPIKVYHLLLTLCLGLPLAVGTVYLFSFLGMNLLLAPEPPAKRVPMAAAEGSRSSSTDPPAADPAHD